LKTNPLVGLATLLLGVSTVLELANASIVAQLWVGIAAGIMFLLAIALRRGSDIQVLAQRARLLAGAGLSALLIVASLWQATDGESARVLLLLIPVGLLFTTAALVLREAEAQRRRARLRELRAHLDGQETERRHWVRELHDETLQELAAVHMLLGVAESGNVQQIIDARRVVGHQIQTLRRLIARMRPLALDTLGLAAALDELARHTADITGVRIEVEADDLPRLPADTETHVYRIAQEALTNAVRHSGTTHITIELHRYDELLELTVRDNGCGLPAGGPAPGQGLTGMRERAEALTARLAITSPGTGTQVRLAISL